MLKQRLATALTGILLVLFFIWLGGISLATFISFLAVLAALELAKVFSFQPVVKYWLCFFAFITFISVYFFPSSLLSLGGFFLLSAVFLLIIKQLTSNQLGLAVFSYCYLLLLSFAIFLMKKPAGNMLILLILIATWLSDTIAYFAGSLFGRHKLAPNISPKKTLEGFITSVVTVIIFLPLIFKAFFATVFNFQPTLFKLAVLGGSLALTATAGDLFESALKRRLKIKDTGALLPGHGGVLDRIDSLLFTLPLGYFLMGWVLTK